MLSIIIFYVYFFGTCMIQVGYRTQFCNFTVREGLKCLYAQLNYEKNKSAMNEGIDKVFQRLPKNNGIHEKRIKYVFISSRLHLQRFFF